MTDEVQDNRIENALDKNPELKKTAEENRKYKKKKAKKLFFLQLPKGFFNSGCGMAALTNAEPTSNSLLRQFCYLKMLELSIPTEGYLYQGYQRYPYTPEKLALALGGFPVDVVKQTVSILEQWYLIEITDDAIIHLLQFQELTSSSSEEAIRKANERKFLEEKQESKINYEELAKIAKTKWLDD